MSSINRGLSHGMHNKVAAKVPRPTESPPSNARHASPSWQSRYGSRGDSFGRGPGRSEHWGNAEYGGNTGGRGRGGRGGRRGGGVVVGRDNSHYGSHRPSTVWKGGENNRRETPTATTPSPSRPPNRFSSASINVIGRGGRGGRSPRPNGGSPNDHGSRFDRLHPVSIETCEDRLSYPGRKSSACDPKGGDENSWEEGSSHASFGHAVKRPAPEDPVDRRSAIRSKSSDSFPSGSTSGEVGSGASGSARSKSFSISSSDGGRRQAVDTNEVVSVCDESSMNEGNHGGGGGGGALSSGKKKNKFKKALEHEPAVRRREKQAKELRFLMAKRDEIKARGDDLKAKMLKNRMEQEEIAIQIEAAEKILALYDNADEEANSAARRKEGEETGAEDAGREADSRSERAPGSSGISRRVSLQLEPSISSTREHLDSGGSWSASGGSTSSVPVRIPSDGMNGGSREGPSSRVLSLQPLQPARQGKPSTPARAPAPASSFGTSTPQVARDASRGESGGGEDFAVSLGDRPKSKSVTAKAPGSFDMRKQIMFTTTRTHAARTLAFNPVQQDCFAVCSNDCSVDMWSYTRRGFELEKVAELNNATPAHAGHIAWNSSGTHLAIGHSSGALMDNCAATIVARDNPDKLMKLRSHMHTKPASAVAWLPPSRNNQDHLVTGGEDKKVVIWTRVLDPASDLYKVGVLHNKQHTSAVRSACCPNMSSPTVVTGGADGRLVSYSIETSMVKWGELLRVSKEYHPQVNELLEFPNNPNVLLVSAVDTGRSHIIFTIDTREARREIHNRPRMEWKRKDPTKSFSANVYPTLSPCGRYVACAGDWNGCFHLWDVRVERVEPMQSVMVSASARVLHTAWHPDPETKSIFSIASGHGADKKHFALQFHAGLRS